VNEWSSVRVAISMASSAGSLADSGRVLRHLGLRRFGSRVPRLRDRHRHEKIRLRSLIGPLVVSLDGGGLATYYEIVIHRIYCLNDSWLPRADDTVVDVGANIGVYSSWAAARVGESGRVIALEPNPKAQEFLVENLAVASNVEIHAIACGENNDELTLYFPPDKLSVGSFEKRPDRTASVVVPVRTLDSVVTAPHIDLMKIDVEGHEIQVLRGGRDTLRRTHRVALEVGGEQLPACVELLAGCGLPLVGERSGAWNLPRSLATTAFFERPA